MGDYQIEGVRVVNWLNKVDHETEHEVLIGCSIDDGESEDLIEIIDIDYPSRILVCRTNDGMRRLPFAMLCKGYVIDERPDAPLKKEVH